MMRNFKILSLSIFALIILSGCGKSTPKKILIIGDSISIGYTPFVESHFSDKATVKHNPGNAQHSSKGLANIKEWIGDEQWDVVQINWGLWDICYRHPDSKIKGHRDKVNGSVTNTVEEYSANLDSIVSIIKESTDATIIFVTTSFVPEKEPGRYAIDAVQYNIAAKKIMAKHGIIVNDIYEKSVPIHNKYNKGTGDVHYTKKGYEELSKIIIDFIENQD